MPRLLLLTLLCAAGALAQTYRVRHDQPRQTLQGLGFEIQSDSIGSDNLGLPDQVVAVPHDLTPAERQRFYRDMLRGFRYCRLAMGLYLRGLDAERKRIVERYPGQMRDLREMAAAAGVEGFAPEYWSPAPGWKSNGKYQGGTLASFEPAFLSAFADALVDDIRYLESHGLQVSMWGLQNEPPVGHGKYSTCSYTAEQYYQAMRVVAPRIRQAFPKLLIHADSWGGQSTGGSRLIRQDPQLLPLIGAWTWHRIGTNSDELIAEAARFNADAHGRPVFNNEFEYLQGPASDERFLNTAHSILNWFVFENAPTWFWLHALKPTYNAEASGYALGFWRPPDDRDFTKMPQIAPGHWDYNPQNFNSLAGFLRHLPWDSVRLHVEEPAVRKENRIMAWRTPQGKLGLALTNRTAAPFRFSIDAARAASFAGFRYTARGPEQRLARQTGPHLVLEVPPLGIEFWLEP